MTELILNFISAPAPVGGLITDLDANLLTLSWTSPVGLYDQLLVQCQPACYRGHSLIQLDKSDTHVFFRLEFDTTYTFSVYSVVKRKSSYKKEFTFTTGEIIHTLM